MFFSKNRPIYLQSYNYDHINVLNIKITYISTYNTYKF